MTGKGLASGNSLHVLFEPAVLAAAHEDGPRHGIVTAKGLETASITPGEGRCPLDLDGDQAAFLPRPIGHSDPARQDIEGESSFFQFPGRQGFPPTGCPN